VIIIRPQISTTTYFLTRTSQTSSENKETVHRYYSRRYLPVFFIFYKQFSIIGIVIFFCVVQRNNSIERNIQTQRTWQIDIFFILNLYFISHKMLCYTSYSDECIIDSCWSDVSIQFFHFSIVYWCLEVILHTMFNVKYIYFYVFSYKAKRNSKVHVTRLNLKNK